MERGASDVEFLALSNMGEGELNTTWEIKMPCWELSHACQVFNYQATKAPFQWLALALCL